jgi:hypothetical protein
MSNYPILNEQVSADGKLILQINIQNLDQVMCDVSVSADLASDTGSQTTYPSALFGMFVFRSLSSLPTFSPTAKPTQSPTKGLPDASALAAQAPLPISLSFTAVFALLAFYIVGMTKRHKRVQRPPLISTCVTCGFMGFSLVAELFLVIMMISFPKYWLLAGVIIIFRMLHPITFAYMAYRVFVTEAAMYEELLDMRYIFENSKIYGFVAFASILDVSNIYLLPWFDSEMTRKCSFPNAFFFTRCLSVKFVQSTATICCQSMFIIGINSGNLGQISVVSLVFLGFNILATVVLALLNMMDLFVKTSIVNNGVLKNAAEMPPKDDVETDLELLFGRRMDGEEIAAFRNALSALYKPGADQPLPQQQARYSLSAEATKSPLARDTLAEAAGRAASQARMTRGDSLRLSHGNLYERNEAVPSFDHPSQRTGQPRDRGAVLSLALATTQPQPYMAPAGVAVGGGGGRRDTIPALRASVVPVQQQQQQQHHHHHRFPSARLNPGATFDGATEQQHRPITLLHPPVPPTPPRLSLRKSGAGEQDFSFHSL